MLIYGINPVIEALRAGRVREVRFSERLRGRMLEVATLAERAGVPVRRVPVNQLDRDSHGGVHQGVVADVDAATGARATLEDLVAPAGDGNAPLIVVLDGVEDPHNLGAIVRTVDASGASGLVRQTRHAAQLSGVAAKASAGATSHVRIVDVVNIARALEDLKAAGVWTVGLAGGGAKVYSDVDLTLPTAFVVGAEGVGLRRLVRERCDWLVSIPMHGHVDSLNVSVAAGVALFEAVRQRNAAAGRRDGRVSRGNRGAD